MSETNNKMIQAMVFVHSGLLQAVIATHPDPERLKEVFTWQNEKLVANLIGMPTDDEFLGMVNFHFEKALTYFPDAG